MYIYFICVYIFMDFVFHVFHFFIHIISCHLISNESLILYFDYVVINDIQSVNFHCLYLLQHKIREDCIKFRIKLGFPWNKTA